MKRNRKNAGEVRVRLSKQDLHRLEWLMKYSPAEPETTSALLRSLIAAEYETLREAHNLNLLAKE